MRGDAASMRPHAHPFTRSYGAVDLFVAVLLGRLDDPAHPSVAGLASRARDGARSALRSGRALDEEFPQTVLRYAYHQARADAAAIKPARAVPEEGPRWWRVHAGLAALRHRQRAALTLFYVLGQSIEHTAAVLGVRPPEARKVVEAGVAQLVRAIREPVDVRRALRTAGSRLVLADGDDPAPSTARMPRAVVRTLLGPVQADAGTLLDHTVEAEAATLVTPKVLEQLEAEGPDLVQAPLLDVEIIPAPRPRRRRDPMRARLAWAAAVVVVLLGTLLPAGAGDHAAPTGETGSTGGRQVVGMEPMPAREVVAAIPAVAEVVVVRPGDSLWRLAGRHLGDSMRWGEIWQLNRGKRMASGLRFRSPGLILPGWRLRLPEA